MRAFHHLLLAVHVLLSLLLGDLCFAYPPVVSLSTTGCSLSYIEDHSLLKVSALSLSSRDHAGTPCLHPWLLCRRGWARSGICVCSRASTRHETTLRPILCTTIISAVLGGRLTVSTDSLRRGWARSGLCVCSRASTRHKTTPCSMFCTIIISALLRGRATLSIGSVTEIVIQFWYPFIDCQKFAQSIVLCCISSLFYLVLVIIVGAVCRPSVWFFQHCR
ncbi:hypothetical protein C8Q74DRAFT_1258798 [Fomes fomentarius]|nr:hypothetical protein C8Q74DRAFT_1258798 [Fomes fomentarius]